MSIKITETTNSQLEQEILEEIENEKQEEQHYLEYIKDPRNKEQPYIGLFDIRENIEILSIKHREVKALVDAERDKLPSAEEARKIIADTRDNAKAARTKVLEAVKVAHTALRELDTAQRAHQQSVREGINKLSRAGIPVTGTELDEEPLDIQYGRITHGDLRIQAFDTPVTYEWSPQFKNYLEC